MALIKKLSVKTVVGNVKKMVASEAITKPTAVMRMFGVATRTQTGEGDNGPYVAFIGQFKAINLLDGTEYTSGKAFLPDVASDLLEGALASEGANGAEFAFDILVVPDESSAPGYVYQAESLIKPSEDDTLARLEKAVTLPTALEDKGKETPADAKEPGKKPTRRGSASGAAASA